VISDALPSPIYQNFRIRRPLRTVTREQPM